MKSLQYFRQLLLCSVCFQYFARFVDFCGKQWSNSIFVRLFVALPEWEQQAGSHNCFFKLWQKLRHKMTVLYQALNLEKVFAGSLLVNPLLWAVLAIFSAALLPTMMALALILLVYLSFLLNLFRHPHLCLERNPINAPCLLMAFFYFGITLTSVDLHSSLFVGLVTLVFMCVPVLIENVASTTKKALLLTQTLVFSATLIALYGLYQFVFGAVGGSGWVDTNMFNSISVRVYSTLQNPNMLAQFLVLVLPFSVALLLSAKDWNGRFIWLVCSGIIALCLLCTYSRGGWIGALLAGGIFVLLLNPKLVLLLPVGLITLYFALPDTIIQRFTSIGNLEDSSTSYRVSIWMGSLSLLEDYWLCGIGPGVETFNMIYPKYSYATASAQHAHNLFLQLVVDGGIFMLLLFLWVIVMFCRETFRFIGRKKNSPHRLYVAASVAGIGGFLAQGMTDYSFYSHRVALAFWIALGLGISWVTAKEDEA